MPFAFSSVWQLLVVLRVKELAEVLAVELNTGQIPRLNVTLRPRDADEAVLSACSTLVVIIQPDTSRLPHVNDVKDNWVVQFSHYSVKEFLTSGRLQSSRQTLSQFYISPEPAHTILAQSCISTLLQLHNSENDLRGFPLAEYTAHNWVDHVQLDGVSTQIRIGMEYLFDPEKPHFNAWVDLQKTFWIDVKYKTPLCFAAFSGFHDVVKHIVITPSTRPQDINAVDSDPPLLAAQRGGHLRVMQFLLGQGADVDCRNSQGMTPLLVTIQDRQYDAILLLLDRRADVNSRDAQHSTPLHEASGRGYLDAV
jgi:Ankyrin repeats (3 copies)